MRAALQCGLTHDQFWRLTPYELKLTLEARGKVLDAELERSALHAAWIINVWAERGKSVTPAQLLGRDDRSISLSSCDSIGDFDAKMRAKQAALDRGRR